METAPVNNFSNMSGIKKFGKGLGFEIKSVIPVLGEYTIGNIDLKHDNLKEDVVLLSKGKDAKCEKEKAGESFLTGLMYAIKAYVPFYGTYAIGQDKIEHEKLKKDITALQEGAELVQTDKQAGVFKTYFKGLGERIKHLIPIYSTYYRGKLVSETIGMEKAVEEIQDAKDAKKA